MAILWLGVSSCATVGRALSSSKFDSDATAQELAVKYHPQGRLEDFQYACSTDGPSQRRAIVYLPPSYDSEPERRYPVMYLFHGARGNETSWFDEGYLIGHTDSLYNCGAMAHTIIVSCNMNEYDDDDDAAGSRFKKPFESFFETNGAVESGFMHDVVARVDSLYRTIPDKDHRAVAGLSVGGMQAIYLSAHYPDAFSRIGLFSPFRMAPIRHSRYSSFYSGLKELQKVQFANPPVLYFIGIGRYDFFTNHVEYYRFYLHGHDYPFEFMGTDGGHDWTNWQQYYVHFASELNW